MHHLSSKTEKLKFIQTHFGHLLSQKDLISKNKEIEMIQDKMIQAGLYKATTTTKINSYSAIVNMIKQIQGLKVKRDNAGLR